MDLSLFSKYSKAIEIQKEKKKEVIELLQEKGAVLQEEQVEIKNKKIRFFVSSAVRAKLHQIEAEKLLGSLGYEVSF